MADPKAPSLNLLMKLGSIVVHTGEMLDEKSLVARAVDEGTVRMLLDDQDVKAWVEAMGPMLPLRRDAR